jgi:hypothetical protein
MKTTKEMTLKEAVDLVRDLTDELDALDISWKLTDYLEEVLSIYDDLAVTQGYAAIEQALKKMDNDLKEAAARNMWLSIMKEEQEDNNNNNKGKNKAI